MLPPIIKKLRDIPEDPGVYALIDRHGKVIYVARCPNLRRRIMYHMTQKSTKKNIIFQKSVIDLDFYPIKDKYEAATLELELIKKHHPPLNGRRQDEKQYRFVRLTTTEDFPRARVVKLNEPKGQTMIGPYPKSRNVKRTFALAVNYYEIADCGKRIVLGDDSVTVKTCLRRKIKQCLRPCEVPVDQDEYNKRVDKFMKFMRGEDDEFLRHLEEKMKEHVKNQEFELAAKVRDNIQSIKKIIKFD